jgi:hypothetical protein
VFAGLKLVIAYSPPLGDFHIHKTFRDLIRDLIEVYIDDIVIKIKSHSSLLDNLAIVFDRSRSMCTMLNPGTCVFRISAGSCSASWFHTEESKPT